MTRLTGHSFCERDGRINAGWRQQRRKRFHFEWWHFYFA